MVPNPAYPTTLPNGLVRLVDFDEIPGPASPVFIWGNIFQLPNPGSQHAFSINTNDWDGEDCATSNGHLKLLGEQHGFQNWVGTGSFTGDLLPFWP